MDKTRRIAECTRKRTMNQVREAIDEALKRMGKDVYDPTVADVCKAIGAALDEMEAA